MADGDACDSSLDASTPHPFTALVQLPATCRDSGSAMRLVRKHQYKVGIYLRNSATGTSAYYLDPAFIMWLNTRAPILW